MKRTWLTIVMLIALGSVTWAQNAEQQPRPSTSVRFAALHIMANSGDKSLAAYQFRLKATVGDVKIVGVEGGEHSAFRDAPYYDPKAIQRERVIVGAFSTGPAGELPSGRTRIATIHVQISGPIAPQYTLSLDTAATADGSPVDVTISLMEGNER